jgi:hypothetical protein
MELSKNIKYYFLGKEIDIKIYYYEKYVLLLYYDSINKNIVTDKILITDANTEKIINLIDKYFHKIKIDIKKNYKIKHNNSTIPEWALDQYFQIDNKFNIIENKSIDFTSKDIPFWVKNEYLKFNNITKI